MWSYIYDRSFRKEVREGHVWLSCPNEADMPVSLTRLIYTDEDPTKGIRSGPHTFYHFSGAGNIHESQH